MSESAVVWIIGVAASVIAWAVRVESKVQAHDKDIDRMTRASDQFRSDMRADFTEVKDRLQYIVERLDGR